MKVECFTCNPFQENTYLAIDESTGRCAILDPGMSNAQEFQQVKDYIASHQLTVEHILLTHGHLDHLMGTGFCVKEYGVEVSGSLSEQCHMPDMQWQANAFGIRCETVPASVTINRAEGDTFMLGNLECRVLDCPGHSFAGLCYYFPNEGVLFTGDVLFRGSVGRSDFGSFMGCDGKQLIEGIVGKLITLPAETRVYPGHGPATTIGYESKFNAFF